MTIKRYDIIEGSNSGWSYATETSKNGEWCLYFDVESELSSLKSENSELRARLAVYEDGKPTTEQLSQTTTEIVFAVDEGAPNKISLCLTADWLKRISSANEVKA